MPRCAVAFPYEEFDLSGVRTYPLASRASKAKAGDFATPLLKGSGVDGPRRSLPNMLGASDFRAVVKAIIDARASGGGIIWGFGAHVIKVGLSPVLVDLAERGFVSAFATNGAGIIHDFEIAIGGATSEDVDETLGAGRFGMAEETGRLLNCAINEGVRSGQGLGQSVGTYLVAANAAVHAPERGCNGRAAGHPAHGTRRARHGRHPHAPRRVGRGAGRGQPARLPVLRLERRAPASRRLSECGSAVVLPEVFLKAVALARNAGVALEGLTTVNLDFVRLYRPQINVVMRPAAGTGGRGYSLVGHHEILIPLLAAALVEEARPVGSDWGRQRTLGVAGHCSASQVSRGQHFPGRGAVARAGDHPRRREEAARGNRACDRATPRAAWPDWRGRPDRGGAPAIRRAVPGRPSHNPSLAYCRNGTS